MVGLHVGLFAIVCSISLFTYAIISKRSHFDWATTRMVTYGHWVTGLDRPTAVLTRVEVAPTALATSPSALVIFRRSVISFARGRQECTHYHADCVSQWCCFFLCSWHTKLTWIGSTVRFRATSGSNRKCPVTDGGKARTNDTVHPNLVVFFGNQWRWRGQRGWL